MKEPEDVHTSGVTTCIFKRLCEFQKIFSEAVPKYKVHARLEAGDQFEVDASTSLDVKGVSIYLSMIRALHWVMTLGRMDIFATKMTSTMTINNFDSAPCENYLDCSKRIYAKLSPCIYQVKNKTT